MSIIVASGASDAAQSVADSLNQAQITGWDLAAAAVVMLACIPLARLAAATVRRALRRAGIASADVAADLGRVAKWLVYLSGLALALSILGVNAGFLSVVFAFALIIGALMLKPMVENSASGILLLARPSFGVGDQIQTTDFRGTVEAIGSRATRLRTQDGVLVYVSNNQVLGNPILVYSSPDTRKASFQIKIPVDADLDDTTSAIVSAVASVDDVVDDPAPAVQAAELVDDAVALSISYWYAATKSSSSGVTDGVIRATISALNGAGIHLAVRTERLTQPKVEGSSSATGTGAGSDSDEDDSSTS